MSKICLILVFCSQLIFSQKYFDEGNKLYQDAKYEEAIDAYKSVLQKGQHSAELYFNIGNSYYKLNKVAFAIYYYEKALLLDPDDKNITNNLNFAKKRTIDDEKDVPEVGFRKLVFDFTSTFHYNTWAKISVLLSFIFLILFILYFYSSDSLKKRLYFIGMFIVVLFFGISITVSITERNYFNSLRPAIVFTEAIPLRSEPQKTGGTILIMHEGRKVNVIESLNEWKKVQLPDETTGWVEKSAIREIKK